MRNQGGSDRKPSFGPRFGGSTACFGPFGPRKSSDFMVSRQVLAEPVGMEPLQHLREATLLHAKLG